MQLHAYGLRDRYCGYVCVSLFLDEHVCVDVSRGWSWMGGRETRVNPPPEFLAWDGLVCPNFYHDWVGR